MTHRSTLRRPWDPRSWRRLAPWSMARVRGGACRAMSVQMHVPQTPLDPLRRPPNRSNSQQPVSGNGGDGSTPCVSSGAPTQADHRRAAERGPWSPASRTATPTPSPILCWPRAARARAGSPLAADGSSPRSPSPLLRDHPVRCAGDPPSPARWLRRSISPRWGYRVTRPEHDNCRPHDDIRAGARQRHVHACFGCACSPRCPE